MKPSELLKSLLEWNDGKISGFYKCVKGDNELEYHCFGFGEITLSGYEMHPYCYDGYISNAFPNVTGGLFLTYSSPFLSISKDVPIRVSSARCSKLRKPLDIIAESDIESIAKKIYDNCSLYVELKKQVDIECAKLKKEENLKRFREAIKEESFVTKILDKLSYF